MIKKILEKHKVYSSDLELELLRHFECLLRETRESLEAAQPRVLSDWLPCGHHKDALDNDGESAWCVACSIASR